MLALEDLLIGPDVRCVWTTFAQNVTAPVTQSGANPDLGHNLLQRRQSMTAVKTFPYSDDLVVTRLALDTQMSTNVRHVHGQKILVLNHLYTHCNNHLIPKVNWDRPKHHLLVLREITLCTTMVGDLSATLLLAPAVEYGYC